MECTFEICVFQLLNKPSPNKDEAEHVANYHHNKAVTIGVSYQDNTYIHTFSRTEQHQMCYSCACSKLFLSFLSMKSHVSECEEAQDAALRHAIILAQHVETANLLDGSSSTNPAPQSAPTSSSSSPPPPPPPPLPLSSSPQRQLPSQSVQPSPRSSISCDAASSSHCATVPRGLREPQHRQPSNSPPLPTENVPDLEPSIDSAILRYLRRLERNQTVLENTVKNQEQTIQQQKTEMAELRTELAYINGIKGKTHTKCQVQFHENTPASASSHNPPYQPSYNWREAEEIILCLKEEVMEEVIEEVVLEARGNAMEEIVAEIKKEILDEVIEEAVSETVEEFGVREIIEELMVTVKQEVMEEVIEEVIMKISEEVREEANVEVMVEVMEDVGLEAKEKVTEEKEVNDETTTRVDAMEDTRARIRKAEEDELDEEPKKKRHLRTCFGVELVDSFETDAAEQSDSIDYQGLMTDSGTDSFSTGMQSFADYSENSIDYQGPMTGSDTDSFSTGTQSFADYSENSIDCQGPMTGSDTDSFSTGTPSFADYSETSAPRNQEEAQNLESQFDTENSNNHQPDTHTGTQDADSQTDTHTRSPNRRDDTYTQGAAERPS